MLPALVLNPMSSSPSSLTRSGAPSRSGSSSALIAGTQYCRIKLPIGVPGPMRHKYSLSSLLSIGFSVSGFPVQKPRSEQRSRPREATLRFTMAEIVAGFASSHTPLMSLPGEHWAKRAEDDTRNRELIRPKDGAHVTYDELLQSADPKIKEQLGEETFCKKYQAIQNGLDELDRAFAKVDPDVVVMFGDDQDEMFFDDNYPMISV